MLVSVKIYSLNQIVVFCDQQPELQAQFAFKMCAFHFNICV